MFSSSPCLQQHHRRMSFLSLSLQYLQWIRFLLSIAAQTCAHMYQSFIPMPEEYFFPKDLTDGRAPRFAKVSLETKYNIVVGTQIVLKPGALDGLQKLKMSWVRTFCCRRTLRKFSCGFMMLFVHHSIPTEVRRNEWRIILFRSMVGLKSMFTIWLLITYCFLISFSNSFYLQFSLVYIDFHLMIVLIFTSVLTVILILVWQVNSDAKLFYEVVNSYDVICTF